MARSRSQRSAEPDLIVDPHRPSTAAEATPQPPLSRVARQEAQQRQGQRSNFVAHPRMRRKLNWALAIVSVLIVAVYLILFFV